VTVLDREDGSKFRGAVIWAINGDEITVRIQLEAFYVGDRVIPRSLIECEPDGIRAPVLVGQPVVVRLEGCCADDYQVVAIRGGRPSMAADEAELVRQGVFAPSLLNGVLRGVDDYL